MCHAELRTSHINDDANERKEIANLKHSSK